MESPSSPSSQTKAEEKEESSEVDEEAAEVLNCCKHLVNEMETLKKEITKRWIIYIISHFQTSTVFG